MANPNPSPSTRFGGDRANHGNAGGRTPSRWLREFLDAAYDKGPTGQTRREAVAAHLFEIATSWKILHFGENLDVASGRDAVEAAKLLFGYDMGKPAQSVEVSNPDGTLSPQQQSDRATTAELRARLEAILAAINSQNAPKASDGPADGDTKPSDAE